MYYGIVISKLQYHMYEIELKYKFKNKISYSEVIEALSGIIDKFTWSNLSIQEDLIFRKKKYINAKINSGEKIFRIRKTLSQTILTLKVPEDTSLTYTEFESKVDNFTEIQNMLIAIGYTQQVTILKSRGFVHYKNFTLCFDEVEGLGSFIEIELISDIKTDIMKNDNDLIIKEILSKLDSFKPTPIYENYVVLAIKID
jgi:predicted adenylyl cyclase CyaB